MKDPIKSNLKKLRVQLFDPDMNQLEDRLVSQDLELTKGPKEPHKGPMKLEFCLFGQPDVELAIGYLKRLSGDLPLVVKTPKTRALKKAYSDDPSWRESLHEKIQESEFQDEFIKELRSEGFIFMTSDHLSDAGIVKDWSVFPAYFEQYQWMIKLLKEAKNPVNNKYDPNLLFGFKILGQKEPIMLSILHGKFHEFSKEWKAVNKLTFRKTDMVKFPHYMVMEERERFRVELYKARKDPDNHKFSKFFKRWYMDVDFREKPGWSTLIEAPGK
jgi:hypothetical protein